jgi:hypothetical protein
MPVNQRFVRVEGMKAGKPVIGTATGATPDPIRQGHLRPVKDGARGVQD